MSYESRFKVIAHPLSYEIWLYYLIYFGHSSLIAHEKS